MPRSAAGPAGGSANANIITTPLAGNNFSCVVAFKCELRPTSPATCLERHLFTPAFSGPSKNITLRDTACRPPVTPDLELVLCSPSQVATTNEHPTHEAVAEKKGEQERLSFLCIHLRYSPSMHKKTKRQHNNPARDNYPQEISRSHQ